MKYRYSLRIDDVTDELGRIHTVYGVVLSDRLTSEVLDSIPDVFYSIEQAETFVKLCNRLKLSPAHLTDAIEDAIDS